MPGLPPKSPRVILNGPLIRQMRQARKMSIVTLARAAGFTVGRLNQIERCETARVNPIVAQAIADQLKATISFISSGIGTGTTWGEP